MEFLTWRCWIGFWVMIILFGVVALEGCFLIKYFTRFTEDIFELLISAIFIYEPIALLIKVRFASSFFLVLFFPITPPVPLFFFKKRVFYC